MILPWLYRSLPGPGRLRIALLLLVAAALALFLWDWGFACLVQHFGSVLNGSPTVNQKAS